MNKSAMLGCALALGLIAGGGARAASDLWGTYQAIPDGVVMPGGFENHGGPDGVQSRLQAAGTEDPAKFCVPVGPFRSMGAAGAKIELVPTSDKIVILFQDVSHGDLRIVYLRRGHPGTVKPYSQGDSIGVWKQGVLQVDTVGLGHDTWLNAAGALHSDALHLSEQFRPVAGGQYIEYQATLADPKALAKPYTYIRYFRKTDNEITDDSCVIESN